MGWVDDITMLFAKDEYYGKRSAKIMINSVYPSIANRKYLTWEKDEKVIGFASYGFLKEKEISENKYNGTEVFCRDDGEVLHVCQFVCAGDRKDVFRFARQIQKKLSKKYPDRPFATAIRKKSGSERPAKYVKGLAS